MALISAIAPSGNHFKACQYGDPTRGESITALNAHVAEDHKVDIHKWLSRTALELIGQSGLGYSFDPLVEGRAVHPYSDSLKELMWVPE